MTKEQLKEMLESYWFDNQYLNEKLKEVESIKNKTKNLLRSETSDLKANVLSPIIEQQEQEQKIIAKILKRKQYIEDLIQSLSQPYRTLSYMKYVGFLTFDQIADRMNYSTKRIYQLHNEALNKLLDIVNAKELNISTN